ncbi:uncharacterized protein BXZ73DRAFT_90130 [Epithele typhae]|uniref:uncharacterized protein n=1 Tax=Epithele typhae TaxID=378194 RepID=UPI002008C1F2|nr:uncharacterized protein BXZ73DRAFT_90130 [Epithele typhae]KAH9931712.1 hypothetical protein BXZ73DRAFT_90130 [Epithele typhae]
MSRQLRTRKSRPNYAELAGLGEDDDDAGPSNHVDSELSGSDFDDNAAAQDHHDEDEEMVFDPEEDGLDDEAGPSKRRRQASTREAPVLDEEYISAAPRRKKAGTKAASKKAAPSIANLASASSRQVHAPLPNKDHRHRSTGLYRREGGAERLASPPSVFGPENLAETSAWGASNLIAERVNKSWGYNTGPGPLWELIEDRCWFKESHGGARITEADLRPRVYPDVSLGEFQVLSQQDALPFLPNKGRNPVPPIVCSFGPLNKQARQELQVFDAIKMSHFFSESKSHVFNAGGPVWGLDWCPTHPEDRKHHGQKQFIAVAPFPSVDYSPTVGSRIQRPSPGCIQIWSLGPSTDTDSMDVDSAGQSSTDDRGEMCCEMVLCVDGGPAFEVKWCPLPSGDPNTGPEGAPRKLGILAGTFGDGSLSFYTVPDPTALKLAVDHPANTPIFVKLTQPILRIELEETALWCMDWADSELVAAGCANGSIAVYNIAAALRMGPGFTGLKQTLTSNWLIEALIPTHYFTAHQSAIRSLAWVRTPEYNASKEVTGGSPTVIASGGYDGVESVTDIRNMLGVVLNRTRDVVTAMCYSTYSGSTITIDHENMVKAYSLSPVTLGRGHTVLEPGGPAWSLAASEHHPQLAIGATDGSLLTTNTLRSTRRGGLVPFLEHKIYQLDYSRTLGEYRMLENFLPQETQNRQARHAAGATPGADTTSAWPPEVGVHRVVWNDGNGLGRASLVASGTASGLCRIDWLEGRWARDPPPYGGVEGVRSEVVGSVGLEEDDDESD